MDDVVKRRGGWRRRGWIAGAALLAIGALVGAWIVSERQAAVSCRPFASPRTEIWLALGQSNAANHAEVRYSAGPRVAAFNGHACLDADDPLPGGDGSGGSIWGLLAQAWVAEGRAERVLIAMSAQSSTSVAEWRPGSLLHRRATDMVEALEGRGLKVSRILWVQGEADVILGTDSDTYREGLTATLEPLHRQTGAPVFVALVGHCGDAASPAIRSAQARLIGDRDWAVPGPDLDRIGPEQRYQRCHFARRGHGHAVALWLAALKESGS